MELAHLAPCYKGTGRMVHHLLRNTGRARTKGFVALRRLVAHYRGKPSRLGVTAPSSAGFSVPLGRSGRRAVQPRRRVDGTHVPMKPRELFGGFHGKPFELPPRQAATVVRLEGVEDSVQVTVLHDCTS